MARYVLVRGLALGLAVIGFVIGVWFGCMAIRLGITSSWETQRSNWIEMVPNTAGTWEVGWEPTWRIDRARPLVAHHEYPQPDEGSPAAKLSMRVEPMEALDDVSRARAGNGGWIQGTSDSLVILGIEEPALVRRIEWKIGNVAPSMSAPPFRLSVPGNPDSEFPSIWPFYAALSFFALGVASALTWWARRPAGRARSATFDVI